jgi:hypothetical protein
MSILGNDADNPLADTETDATQRNLTGDYPTTFSAEILHDPMAGEQLAGDSDD